MASQSISYQLLAEAFNQRRWARALELATALLPTTPREPSVYYIAGISSLELHRIAPALKYLDKAMTLAPARADYAAQLAKTLMLANLSRDAKIVADRAWALSPTDAATLDTLGVVYSQTGDYDLAVAAFRKVILLTPDHAHYRYNLATALVAAGNLDDAEEEIEACLLLDPNHGRAHLTLAQLRRQTAESNHVSRLRYLLESIRPAQTNVSDRICLNMALFKEYEDLENYAMALKHLIDGKSAGGAHRKYSATHDERLFNAIINAFPVTCPVTNGYTSREPIFVIGMPRTGTTLVERIVSSHPDVQSAGELLNLALSVKQISGTKTSTLIDVDTIAQAHNTSWRQLGEMYLSSTRPLTGSKAHFVDKLPHNFLYVGWIANALPNAKIICLRRNPMDTCLSNFRQLFAPRATYFDYSFDLLDTGRYYILFDRLMAHWRQIFPGRILEVNYETLVENQLTESRRIIEFCQLHWSDDCLHFEKNPSPVATASAVQVRSPIYRSSMQRWKKYGNELSALHSLLEQAGVLNSDFNA